MQVIEHRKNYIYVFRKQIFLTSTWIFNNNLYEWTGQWCVNRKFYTHTPATFGLSDPQIHKSSKIRIILSVKGTMAKYYANKIRCLTQNNIKYFFDSIGGLVKQHNVLDKHDVRVMINWSTAKVAELYNKYFLLERSYDANF